MKENTSKTPHTLFIVAVVSLLIILGYGIYLLFQKENAKITGKKSSSHKVIQKVTPSPLPRGTFWLVKNKEGMFSINEVISVSIKGSSLHKTVTGFDVVLKFDPSSLHIGQVQETLSANYRYIIKKNTDSLIISGIPLTQETNLLVFENTTLSVVEFTIIKPGNSTISIEYIPHSNTDSNLLCEGKDILTETKGIEISSGQQVTLLKNKPLQVPGTVLTLTLIETVIPEKACRDCFSKTSIDIYSAKEGTKNTIAFSSGGFAGLINDTVLEYGYQFKLIEMKKDSAIISIIKE